ncbi:MAG: prolyl oligopeptidase family serine peptidase [Candidatus Hadarchaeota archaeon]
MEKKFPLEEIASLPEFYHAIVSPKGNKIAFYWDKTGRNELYTIDVKSREITRISDGEVPRNARWFLKWKNEEEVLFHKDREGNEQNDIYSIDMEGNVNEIIDFSGQCIIQDVSSDGDLILFSSDRDDQLNLYTHYVGKGETKKITDYERPVLQAIFSPDDKLIAYRTNESSDLENKDVYICNADGNEKKKLEIGDAGYEKTPVGWGPEGKRLLVADNTTDMTRSGIYNVKSENISWYGSEDYEEYPVSFTPDGDGFIAVRAKRGARVPLIYGLKGKSEELELNEGVCGFPHGGISEIFTSKKTSILSYTTSKKRKELYEYDLEKNEFKILLEAEYGNIKKENFVESDYITYESSDGLKIGGILYKADKNPSPAIVFVHGGPHAQATRGFDIYSQFLVNRGYTVLKPNYRGSTGRGRKFKRMIHMDWGGKEQEDIAEGGKWLKNRDWIDDKKVAVFGGSYGGYSTYMQMVKYPKLWTTGIAWVGITDLHKLYSSDMPHFQAMLEEQMGDPEENYELWRERSPIEKVENIERPILIIHGVNDRRCPIEQARLFKESLEKMGWKDGEDFEYRELEEEGHGSTDIEQKIRAFEILEKYLKRTM